MVNRACQRELPKGVDLVFPLPNRTSGRLCLGYQLQISQIDNLLNSLAAVQMIAAREKRRFTSHSFRRGGAQDETVEAAERGDKPMSLRQALWWGGWDEVDTMITYIMEKRQEREEYFGDIQNPSRQPDPSSAFTAEQDRMMLGIQEKLGDLEKQLLTGFQHMQQQIQQLLLHAPPANRAPPPAAAVASVQTPAAPAAASAAALQRVAAFAAQQPFNSLERLAGTSASVAAGSTASSLISSGTAINKEGKPLAQRIPPVRCVEDVVRQWERGDPAKGLIPLHEWTQGMRHKCKGGGNAQVFSLRKTIYEAYERRGRNLMLFYQAYGGPNKPLIVYIDAIKKEKRARAEMVCSLPK